MTAPTITLEIVERRLLDASVVVLDLRDAEGGKLPPFTAGAHIDLHLPDGPMRQYSLCNDPAERHRYCIAVRLLENGRGGSRAAHDLQPGDRVNVGLPRNLFALEEAATHSILLAGGIGITPLLAMAHRLEALGASFELHYRARQHAMSEAIASSSWANRATLSSSAHGPIDFTKLLGTYRPGTHLYLCGPQGFMTAALTAAGQWPEAALHSETFTPATVVAGDRPFQVQLASDGTWHDIPVGRSIIEVLADAGVYLPTSCEQGICGTCRTGVLAGMPDHRDLCLTEAQHQSNKFITPCCSRALTERLVLDL